MIRKKIIYGCESRGDGQDPYLTRYTLLETRWGNLYLHVFHRSDHDVLHDHPWAFTSLILWRGYVEETPEGKRRKWPGMLLVRKPEHRHRVILVGDKPAVTLVWRGPYVRQWGFWEASGWTHWQDYFRKMGC